MDDSGVVDGALQLYSVRYEDSGSEVEGGDVGGECGWKRSLVVLGFSGLGVVRSTD